MTAVQVSGPVQEGKYKGYTVTVDQQDYPHEIWFEDRGPYVLRVHYRVYRIPARREIRVRHFTAATAEDRAKAEAMIPKLPHLWAAFEGKGMPAKRRHSTLGHWYWTLCMGSYVDDPLAQLELEMMIDLEAGVSSC